MDARIDKCHPKFLTNCLMDQLWCCHSNFFLHFLRVCLESETEIVSMHMCVCAPEDARTHLPSDCLAAVFQAHGRSLWQFRRERGERGRESDRDWVRVREREREREEGEGGSLPSQPGSLSAYTIFQLNLKLSNVGYAARVSSIFPKRSAISCFGTHGALTDTHGEYTPYSPVLLVARAFGIVTYREITV